MLVAMMLLAGAADWVPMRWGSADPKSLELIQGTAVNCILVERAHWSEPLVTAARRADVTALAVVRPSAGALRDVEQARGLKFPGIVLEGDFDGPEKLRAVLADSKIALVELPSRARMKLDGSAPIAGTYQGVWPGIAVEESGSTKAAPSGAPWINTNSGFLRFLRAVTPAVVWLGHVPPPKRAITTDQYLAAIADSAMIGARWILAFDEDWSRRLYARDPVVLKEWKRVAEHLAYFEQHAEWRGMQPAGQLALIQDVSSGALFSGGILDMIAVKHTPVRAVPVRKLDDAAMTGPQMAVNVDPAAMAPGQKDALRKFTRNGGTLLNGPAGWKFPEIKPDQITLKEDEVKFLDDVWKEVNTMTGRRNLGARLFNVSSMLSNLVQAAGGDKAVLHLVNYSGYPVENVTVHLLGKWKTATLLAPGEKARPLKPYDNEEGTGVDIDTVGVLGTVVLE